MDPTKPLTAAVGIRTAVADTVHNQRTLKNNRSLMEHKRDQLLATESRVVAKFRIYWFPRLLDTWSSDVEKLTSGTKKLAAEGSTVLGKIGHVALPDNALIPDIKTECTELDKAIQEGIKLEDALVKRGTMRIVKHTGLVNIEKVKSLKVNLRKLLMLLKDVDTNSIRVHGPAGTGKKLLLQHLNNYEELVNMFDIVIWCDNTNSTETNIPRLIAERLGLDVGSTSDTNYIASRIKEELKGARYLLLLNDVKARITLDTLGMPMNKNGSKIVYTTYLRFVLPFCPFETMPIERLEKPDSWQMFANILNDGNAENILQGEIEATSHKVVDICDGLFSLIKIVASNFRKNRSVETWREGLQRLRRLAQKGDMYMKAMENIMDFSYDGLKDNQKLCFLFSILYPEDNQIPIDYLFDCWTTLKLVEFGVTEGSSETSRREILEHLLEVALLNEGSSSQYVEIERILRRATMKKLREQGWFKCLVAEEALEILKSGNCEDTQWISLNNSEIEDLNGELDCGNLTTLFLQKNSKLKTMSSSFFKKMKKLLILDLHKTKSELVLPMTDMESLKVLYVNDCVMLKEFHFNPKDSSHYLEVLDIRGRQFNEIPPEIKNFKALRRLMMSIHGSATFPSIIRELSSLRELIIDVEQDVKIPDQDTSITRCNRVIENSIEQIGTLTELTTLKFCFGDEIVDVIQVMGDTLKIFVPKQTSLQHIWKKGYKNSRELQVYIGFRMSPNLKIPRNFIKYDSFVLSSLKTVIKPEIKDVLSKVKAIIMMDSSTLENLDQTTMPHVYYCLVQSCNKIVTLINQTDGFSNLETLILSGCSQLKALFLNNEGQTTMSIKHLEIRDCLAIEEINMSLNSGGDILPKLKKLVLHNLWNLTKICSDLEWPSLTTLEIHECPVLTEIPLNADNANKLHDIKVEKNWWEALQLDDGIKQKFEQSCEFSDRD
ncbi:hypothetical protein SSX86_005364 [Deinandra increscens subsp. villosa]|uniref:NB-ARC domain-containing protein n=1 Tax=Deinandra increscens subsp. villosa TaxID=3103831 RepID=A0AAP0DLD0_9ASTR